MILKKTEYVQHIFNDTILLNNPPGYPKYRTDFQLTFKIPSYFTQCNDDPDYIKKNIRRFQKRKDVWDDEGLYIDVYLENCDTGNSGWLLRDAPRPRNSGMDTQHYVVKKLEGEVIKNKHVGDNCFIIYKTNGPYTVYLSPIRATLSSLVIIICDPKKQLKRRDLKGLLRYTIKYGERISKEDNRKIENNRIDNKQIDKKQEEKEELREYEEYMDRKYDDYEIVDGSFPRQIRDKDYKGNKYLDDRRFR